MMNKQVNDKRADPFADRDHWRHDRTAGQSATSAQFRDEMPSGRTVGRSSARDPAAAPMDTDDEAAGQPPASNDVQHAGVTLRYDELPGRGLPREFGLDEPDYTYDPAARGQALITAIVVAIMVIGCAAVWLAMR